MTRTGAVGAGLGGEPLRVADYVALAREGLPAPVWHYFEGASGDERTARANLAAFDRIRLRPRILVDVSQCDMSTTLLDVDLAMPVGVAPMGYQELATPEGELATVRAAGAVGALTVVSIFASRALEDVAASATGPLWLQLYWLRRRDVLQKVIERAEAAGFRALVLTIDTPRLGRRQRDLRHRFHLPRHIAAVNLGTELAALLHEETPDSSALDRHARAFLDPSLSWSDLDWLRSITKLPILLKGVLTGEDAARAVSNGVDGVIVSNHGGRQLDGAVASVDALPEVVAAVNRRCPVLLDGGVRRGTDVLTALALGADAVLVGRPVLYGLAARGDSGARHVLTLLRDELEDAMALAGCAALDTVDASLVTPETAGPAAPTTKAEG